MGSSRKSENFFGKGRGDVNPLILRVSESVWSQMSGRLTWNERFYDVDAEMPLVFDVDRLNTRAVT